MLAGTREAIPIAFFIVQRAQHSPSAGPCFVNCQSVRPLVALALPLAVGATPNQALCSDRTEARGHRTGTDRAVARSAFIVVAVDPLLLYTTTTTNTTPLTPTTVALTRHLSLLRSLCCSAHLIGHLRTPRPRVSLLSEGLRRAVLARRGRT